MKHIYAFIRRSHKDFVELEEVDHLDYDFEYFDNDVQTCIDMTDEEIVNFCMKKPSVEIEEELEELSLENVYILQNLRKKTDNFY
jgi:hypothetical protein